MNKLKNTNKGNKAARWNLVAGALAHGHLPTEVLMQGLMRVLTVMVMVVSGGGW